MSDLSRIMLAVAKEVWGDPRPGAKPNEVRFGQGRTVKPTDGVWYIHGSQEGGGVLHLLERECHVKGAAAFDWLREHGFDVEDRRESRNDNAPKGSQPTKTQITATWDYTDENNNLLYQVCRIEPDPKDGTKTYGQRRPNGNGGWVWKLGDMKPTLFRLPELLEDIASGCTIFIPEGEKCVEALAELGIPATTNSGGSGKFPAHMVDIFSGADVVLLPDNDKAGSVHADKLAALLQPVCKRLRRLELPGLGPKGDVYDWIRAGGTTQALYDFAAAAPVVGEVPYASPLGAIRFKDIDRPGPTHTWLVKGLVTAGERAMIVGPSGSGKTFIALDVSMSIARGLPFFGHRTLPGLVLYQAGEGGSGLVKRVKAYRQHNGIAPDADLPFVLLPKKIDLFTSDDFMNLLIAEAKHWQSVYPDNPLRLIVIDTFSKATSGADENSAKDVGPILDRAGRIGDETGATVMIVHHMNADGVKPRGHTSINADLDSVLGCVKGETKDNQGRWVRTMSVRKVKDGEEEGREYPFVLQSVTLGIDSDNDAITSCVIDDPDGEVIHETDYDTFTTAMTDTYNAIRIAYNEASLPIPGILQLPKSITQCVLLNSVVSAFVRHIAVLDDKATEKRRETAMNTIRQTIKRGGVQLKEQGYIGRDDKTIWMTGKQPAAKRGARKQVGRPAARKSSRLPPDAEGFY